MIPAGGRNRWLDIFYQAAPVLFLVLLFRKGLECWFIADDFAWLSLIHQVFTPHDLLRALFEPAAQGTVRPWSERGFFLLFEYLFGVDALPFRIMAFVTMAADTLLVNWLTRKITGSPLAGFVAAVCWSANTSLMTVMTWSASYNEAMCPFFLMLALSLFMRYVETGRKALWWWQLAVFSLGFGALEINVVYPALAAAYVLFVVPRPERRRLITGLWPLFSISVVYFLWHRAVSPLPTSGSYVVHVDWRVLKAVALYGKWSLLPVDWVAFGHSAASGKWILWTGIALIAALAVSEIRRRRGTILFFISWWLITIAPVLVLPDHHSDYYLTIPVIGLGMLFGFGVTCGIRGAGKWGWLALIPVVAYLCGMVPISDAATEWTLNKTKPIRGLVLGLQAAREKHPAKTILIDGLTKDMYGDSIGQGALIPLGLNNVYLTPETARVLESSTDRADTETTVLDPDITLHAIKKDELVIYSVVGDHLRNITEVYERSAPNRSSDVGSSSGPGRSGDRLPSRVDAGNPLYSWLLGPTWLSPESGVRWMPGHATVRLRGPDRAGAKLEVSGFFPAEQLKRAPRVLKITADGLPVGEVIIHDPESSFDRLLDMPNSLVGRDSVEIGLDATPVDVRGGQQYGMVFGKIAVRP